MESNECSTKKPAQELVKKNISELETKVNSLLTTKNAGLGTDETDCLLTKLQKNLAEQKKKLIQAESNAKRQKKYRDAHRTKLADMCDKIPEAAEILKIKSTVGRPRLETDQPDLLKVIIDLATHGSGADDRRRSEMIRCCKTLDDLHDKLKAYGYNLSRSAMYLRLIPRRFNSEEGKRHVKTVPVKLTRAQTSEHKQHIDTAFAVASIRALESIASFLGPKEVFFISQDDKARIALGITAANKQSAILMHLDYRVVLPDHDWVKAEKHKLIPSVYAGIEIKENGMDKLDAVTYSGPTYVAIRSAKHNSSTASSHSKDIDDILNSDLFKPLCRTENGSIKPIMIISVDGGPDENPRYEKVIQHSIDHFKKYKLDAFYVVTNAPGRSAYNRVERRMAPLSHQLSGVILPYDHFGNHLNSQGKTIDEEIEKQNFKHAGEVLCDIWNELSIDGYDVEAKYIEDISKTIHAADIDASWYAHHVRESQYLLQIVKCDSELCCEPYRSSLKRILPNRFLPAPMKIKQCENGGFDTVKATDTTGKFMPLFYQLSIHIKHNIPEFKQVPYDTHCPSVIPQLANRVCKFCGLYFASKKSVLNHIKKIHPKEKFDLTCSKIRPVQIAAYREKEAMCIIRDTYDCETVEWIDVEEIEDIGISNTAQDCSLTPLIDNYEEHLSSFWSTE